MVEPYLVKLGTNAKNIQQLYASYPGMTESKDLAKIDLYLLQNRLKMAGCNEIVAWVNSCFKSLAVYTYSLFRENSTAVLSYSCNKDLQGSRAVDQTSANAAGRDWLILGKA